MRYLSTRRPYNSGHLRSEQLPQSTLTTRINGIIIPLNLGTSSVSRPALMAFPAKDRAVQRRKDSVDRRLRREGRPRPPSRADRGGGRRWREIRRPVARGWAALDSFRADRTAWSQPIALLKGSSQQTSDIRAPLVLDKLSEHGHELRRHIGRESQLLERPRERCQPP